MSYNFSQNGDNYNQYRNEFMPYIVDEDRWYTYNYLNAGTERHACGIINRISDDHKLLFVSGGSLFWHDDRGGLSCCSEYDSHHAASFDLTSNPSSWNYTMSGTIRESNLRFTSISPYEGYIFQWGGGVNKWWIWDERKEDFIITNHIKYPRESVRYEFSVASIPKTSPMVKNCL